MKKIKIFAAVIITFLTINAAKAQVGVHVGLNFGTPYPYHRVYAPAPVYGGYYGPRYYPPAPVYYGPRVVYGPRRYYRPVPVERYYGRPYYRGGYHRGGGYFRGGRRW
ncbi:hypothetical protein GCM10027037_14490 [Mucilaginibacter koreensis]